MENLPQIQFSRFRLASRLLVISFLLAGKALAQPLSSTLQQQAYQAVQASVLGDYATLLTYTYPRLVKLVGGPQNMLALLKQQAFPALSQPIHVLIEQPGPIYPAGKELHVPVPYVLTIPQQQTSVRLRGYQLAVSVNQGRHWYFVPTDQKPRKSVYVKCWAAASPRLSGCSVGTSPG